MKTPSLLLIILQECPKAYGKIEIKIRGLI